MPRLIEKTTEKIIITRKYIDVDSESDSTIGDNDTINYNNDDDYKGFLLEKKKVKKRLKQRELKSTFYCIISDHLIIKLSNKYGSTNFNDKNNRGSKLGKFNFKYKLEKCIKTVDSLINIDKTVNNADKIADNIFQAIVKLNKKCIKTPDINKKLKLLGKYDNDNNEKLLMSCMKNEFYINMITYGEFKNLVRDSVDSID